MKIAVIGLGFVGKAMLDVLASCFPTIGFDIDPAKGGQAATLEEAISFADHFLLCLPTNYDDAEGRFDTTSLEETALAIAMKKKGAVLVVKSTVPMGFCASLQTKCPENPVLFCPEFLRESSAKEDASSPSRIIIGRSAVHREISETWGDALRLCVKNDAPIRHVSLEEAEAIKLFSNAYLAMRIGFFNELDSYAMKHRLDSKAIIEGVGLDPRIGTHYCNPSFGYGGYCLPKDTKQLEKNYLGIPQELITAVVKSNATRKECIVEEVASVLKGKENPVLGIYRIRMENGSESCRYSSIDDLIVLLKARGITPVIYEPLWAENEYMGCPNDLEFSHFVSSCDLILANRLDDLIVPYREKVFTRDIRL